MCRFLLFKCVIGKKFRVPNIFNFENVWNAGIDLFQTMELRKKTKDKR